MPLKNTTPFYMDQLRDRTGVLFPLMCLGAEEELTGHSGITRIMPATLDWYSPGEMTCTGQTVPTQLIGFGQNISDENTDIICGVKRYKQVDYSGFATRTDEAEDEGGEPTSETVMYSGFSSQDFDGAEPGVVVNEITIVHIVGDEDPVTLEHQPHDEGLIAFADVVTQDSAQKFGKSVVHDPDTDSTGFSFSTEVALGDQIGALAVGLDELRAGLESGEIDPAAGADPVALAGGHRAAAWGFGFGAAFAVQCPDGPSGAVLPVGTKVRCDLVTYGVGATEVVPTSISRVLILSGATSQVLRDERGLYSPGGLQDAVAAAPYRVQDGRTWTGTAALGAVGFEVLFRSMTGDRFRVNCEISGGERDGEELTFTMGSGEVSVSTGFLRNDDDKLSAFAVGLGGTPVRCLKVISSERWSTMTSSWVMIGEGDKSGVSMNLRNSPLVWAMLRWRDGKRWGHAQVNGGTDFCYTFAVLLETLGYSSEDECDCGEGIGGTGTYEAEWPVDTGNGLLLDVATTTNLATIDGLPCSLYAAGQWPVPGTWDSATATHGGYDRTTSPGALCSPYSDALQPWNSDRIELSRIEFNLGNLADHEPSGLRLTAFQTLVPVANRTLKLEAFRIAPPTVGEEEGEL